jgi:hypothetical protein
MAGCSSDGVDGSKRVQAGCNSGACFLGEQREEATAVLDACAAVSRQQQALQCRYACPPPYSMAAPTTSRAGELLGQTR